MTEKNLDIEFIKENLDQAGLLQQVGWSAVKALCTTAVILGAVLSVLNIKNISDNLQIYVYTSILSGLIISVTLGVQYYHGKLFRLFDIIYTTSIDKVENISELARRTVVAVVLSLLITGLLYVSQFYGEILWQVGACSVISTGFIYYVFRNKLTDLKTYLVYTGYGIATGTAAYLLGSLVVIAIGLIGFWLTFGILSLETVFTAVYTYLGLLEWVNEAKEQQLINQRHEENRQQTEEAKEIYKRLRH